MNSTTMPDTSLLPQDKQSATFPARQIEPVALKAAAPQHDENGFAFEKVQLGEQLARCRAEALAQHLKAARYLRELRQELFPGEWSRLFADGSLPIKHLRTAQLWARVAGNPTLMSPDNLHRLPVALLSLSALAHVKPDVLQAALEAGRITGDSTAREVKAFVREACGLPEVKTKVPPIPMLI